MIVSEHASYDFGGEAVLPLHYFVLLRKKGYDAYLLTHSRTRKSLENDPKIEQDRVLYMPDTIAHIWLHKVSKKIPDRISVVTTGALMHLITQIFQWKLARRIIRQKSINIVHEPAPVSPSQPSMMFALGVPVIIGPMNGGMHFPPGFRYLRSAVEDYLYFIVRATSHLANLFIPGKLLAARLIVANKRTERYLPFFKIGKVVRLVENGIFKDEIINQDKTLSKVDSPNHVFKLLFVGRLVDWKAIDLLIEALLLVDRVNIHLTIVGSGLQSGELIQMVKDHNLVHKVSFTGWKTREEVIQYYDRSDIFILPSLRECGGAVILEAMARGLTPIALDWGGPQDYIVPETGILIEPKSRQYVITQLAEQITRLVDDPNELTRMGRNAIAHVKQHFTWDDKIEEMINIYRDVLIRGN